MEVKMVILDKRVGVSREKSKKKINTKHFEIEHIVFLVFLAVTVLI